MEELQVTLDKIVPFTSARATFSQVIDEVVRNDYLIIARRYKPAAVIVNPAYFNKLQKAAEELRRSEELRSARMAIAGEFSKYLRKQGKDPYTISEKEVNKILDIKI